MTQQFNNSLRRRARAGRRGNLLVVSVVFVMVVASMGMVMLQMHTSKSRRQLQATDNKRALYIAEAGLAEAFVCVSQGKSGNVGTEAIPAQFADGVYWVEAASGVDDEVSLVSTGLCGTGRFALSIVLKRQIDPLASLGFYTTQDLTVGQGAIVDGYDSTAGTLAEQLDPLLPGDTTGKGAMIAAGQDITLEGAAAGGAKDVGAPPGTMIYGNARPGPTGVVSQAADVTITGSTTPLHQVTDLPTVTPPEVDRAAPWAFGDTGGTIPAGEYKLGSTSIASRSKLRIEGPTVVIFNQLCIKNGATLEVDSTDGQVVIFVEEYLELANGSIVDNVNEDPTGLALFANGTEWIDRDGDSVPDPPVVFDPTGDLFGYVYAPTADLMVAADLHVIGGIASNSLTVEDGGHLTFDLALTKSEVTAAGLPKLIAWRIVELPDSDLVKLRIDPIGELKQAGVTPKPSAVASEDSYVYVKYYDLGGTAQSYTGLYSLFDWSNVDKVIGMVWDDDAVVGDEGQVWTAPATMTDTRVVDSVDRSGK